MNQQERKEYDHQRYLDHQPKKLKSVKPNILELDGRELEEEIERIIKDSPKRWGGKIWTKKEDEIIKRLQGKVSNRIIGEVLGETRGKLDLRVRALREKGFLKR